MIDKGIIWRVGDGKKIDVWNDRWLKKAQFYKVQPPEFHQPTPLKVDKFIDEDQRSWNMKTGKEVLTNQDAELVEKIPLSKTTCPDKLIWRDSIVGTFSIRSAYYEARRLLGKDVVERVHREKIWYRIWSARVALKIKLFMWRLAQNVIPMKMNLQGKRIQVDDLCAVCGRRTETIRHVFF